MPVMTGSRASLEVVYARHCQYLVFVIIDSGRFLTVHRTIEKSETEVSVHSSHHIALEFAKLGRFLMAETLAISPQASSLQANLQHSVGSCYEKTAAVSIDGKAKSGFML